MRRLVIQALDNIDERHVVESENTMQLVAMLLNVLSNGDMADVTTEVADLLDTICSAMRNHDKGEPPTARCWDFSAPERGYLVCFFEDSEDDDGSLYMGWRPMKDTDLVGLLKGPIQCRTTDVDGQWFESRVIGIACRNHPAVCQVAYPDGVSDAILSRQIDDIEVRRS